MSHVFEVEDDEYALLEQFAQHQGSTAQALFRAWVQSVTTSEKQELSDARARWEAIGPSVPPPSDEELLAHPLLRVVGIGAINEPGWAERHDAVFGDTEEPGEQGDE